MKKLTLAGAISAGLLGTLAFAGTAQAGPESQPASDWVTVVNNNDIMPGSGAGQGGGGHGGHGGEGGQGAQEGRKFNSYNQPSVNLDGLVVMRARSKGGMGGGQPTHGIYTRDMSDPASHIIRILDRTTEVPDPNNLGTTFVETPSFPRIDMGSDTIATRGNHQPAWRYGSEGDETRAGTTGIYANPFGELITGASKLGGVPEFSFFEVPEFRGTLFEVFPGSPAVTGGDTIVFKGNYTAEGIGRTGVYYRSLENAPAGGTSPVVLIANNVDTVIPGTTTYFGSTSPPSAANGKVVFAGFDNEEAPTLGGIYLAPLEYAPALTTLVSIGGPVPGEKSAKTFNGLGEGGAFDGRFAGFWGAWGEQTRTVRLYCQTEGNKDRIAFCNRNLVCENSGETLGDLNSVCDDTSDPYYDEDPGKRICYQEKDVPVNQGFFVTDTRTGKTRRVARTGEQFDEFLFWNYSGKTPCTGSGHSEEGGEDDGELARWRSSAFVAVATREGATFNAVFKARKGGLVGIYLRKGPGEGEAIQTVLDTTMKGRKLDSEAPADSLIGELGLEREGLRGRWLVINASMGVEGGSEEDGMAGVYLTVLPK